VKKKKIKDKIEKYLKIKVFLDKESETPLENSDNIF
jgi:hypothetical protein